MEQELFHHLSGDIAFIGPGCGVHGKQCADVVTGHQAGGILAGPVCINGNGRGGHEFFGHLNTGELLFYPFQKTKFHLGQGQVRNFGGCGIAVAASAEFTKQFSHIHFRDSVPGDDIHPGAHQYHSKENIQVFHAHDFLNDGCQIRYIRRGGNGGQMNADPVDLMHRHFVEQLMEPGHLFGFHLFDNQIGDGIDTGSAAHQVSGLFEISGGGGRIGEIAGVFINPQGHDRGLFRGQFNVFFPEYLT